MREARHRHKKYADRRRQDIKFEPGDYVLLSTEHLRQDSPCRKLDWKRIGPFKVLDQVTPVSYRLDLPPSLSIHPVLHVCFLEPFHGPPPVLQEAFDLPDGGTAYSVDQVLDVRTPAHSPHKRWEWLVSWVGYPSTFNLWLPATHFQPSRGTLFNWYKGAGRNKPKPKDLSALISGRRSKRRP